MLLRRYLLLAAVCALAACGATQVKPSLSLPRALVTPVLWIEDLLAPVIGRLAGFRMMIVFEKAA